MKPAIVVLAYSRPGALRRLLQSLESAEYPEKVKLFISLEFGASNDVVGVARSFESQKLIVEITERSKKLGLRNHVIACGDLSKEYGSVIILEDDLVVDPYFYMFVSSAQAFYGRNHDVAGLALYSYQRNEFSNLPFVPMRNGYSTYPMQIACSWGQSWTLSQWAEFKRWYENKSQSDLEAIERLPDVVKRWPESSWKKYFHGFMVERDKYFIYPYQSYSTNCSDPGGVHIKLGTNSHQVDMSLPYRPYREPRFCPISEGVAVRYDSFMEPDGEYVWKGIGYSREELEIDTQGIKPIGLLRKKKFVLTSKPTESHIGFCRLDYRPIEVNFSSVYPNGSAGDLALAESVALKTAGRARHSLKVLSFYSGMDLQSRSVFRAMFLELLQILKKRALRLFSR